MNRFTDHTALTCVEDTLPFIHDVTSAIEYDLIFALLFPMVTEADKRQMHRIQHLFKGAKRMSVWGEFYKSACLVMVRQVMQEMTIVITATNGYSGWAWVKMCQVRRHDPITRNN